MTRSKYQSYSKEQLLAKIKQLEKHSYGLVWEDKLEDVAEQCEQMLPVLHEEISKEISSNESLPNNILIEGDNYHALYALNFTHRNKIDVIYIDPPYNTGKEKEWRYNDKWVDKNDKYRHTHWLSFLSKRLLLSKPLLKNGGLMLISIDDNELAQLKLLCDRVFGENNFVGQWNWFKSATPPNLSNKIKKNIEYIIGYEKSKNNLKYRGIKKISSSDDPITKTQNSLKILKFPPNSINFKFENGIFKVGTYGTKKYPNKLLNTLIIEKGKNKNEVLFENRFVWTQGKLEAELKNKTTINCSKTFVISYKKNEYSEEVPPNLIDDSVGVDTTEEAGKRLFEMFRKKVFEYPKPVSLMKYILSFKPNLKTGSIFLDFFAGSGTTGQAVLELNLNDGGNRQFILCTNNENKICEEVTYPRIKKVIKGYNGIKGIEANLKYYKTDFVEQVITDNDKRILVSRSTELLCIAENTFELVRRSKHKLEFGIYKNNDQFTAIIYDEDAIVKCKKELEELKPSVKTIIYVFSYDQEYNAEDFEDLTISFNVKPIPEAILNVYRKNAKLKRK